MNVCVRVRVRACVRVRMCLCAVIGRAIGEYRTESGTALSNGGLRSDYKLSPTSVGRYDCFSVTQYIGGLRARTLGVPAFVFVCVCVL